MLLDVVSVVVHYFLQQPRQLIQLLTTGKKLFNVVFVVVNFFYNNRDNLYNF